MKANRTFRNDGAEVGVGTLIVFIAMVLVAAVAAAVLINTTGVLQQRAQATGKDATQEVSSNFKLMNVYGERNTTADDVYRLKTHVALAAGATPTDMQELVVRYSDGTNQHNYKYADMTLTWIRGSGSGAVMNPGDLVEIRFDLASPIEERQNVELTLTPETGAALTAGFTTPATYGSNTIVTFR